MSAAADRDGFVRGLLRSILDRCGAVVTPDEISADRALRVVSTSHLAALLGEAIERAPAARADRVREDLSRLLERRYQDLQRARSLERELKEAQETIALLRSRVEGQEREKRERGEKREEAGRESTLCALSLEVEEARARSNELESEFDAEAAARREEIAAPGARLTEALAAGDGRRKREERKGELDAILERADETARSADGSMMMERIAGIPGSELPS